MGFSIKFGNTKYAQSMRYGMTDVIDVTGYREAFPAKASGKSYRESFDELMGFYGMSPIETKCADMRTRTFVINDTALSYYSVAQARNYARLEIDNNIYYIFITGAVQQNSNATLYSFEVDWWHTWICERGELPKLYEGFIVRDNKHYITTHNDVTSSKFYKLIEVGRGAENVNLFDLQELESAYHYSSVEAETTPDTDNHFYWAKITFSESPGTIEGYNLSNLRASTNGLYTVFLPLLQIHAPYATSTPLGAIYYASNGTTELGISYSNLDAIYSLINKISISPKCVSIEIVTDIPVIKSDYDGDVALGGQTVRLVKVIVNVPYNSSDVYKKENNPPIFQFDTRWDLLSDNIAKSTLNGHRIKAQSEADILGILNTPRYTNTFYPNFLINDARQHYKHTALRTEHYVEPKLAQPQYSKVIFTDNQGGTFEADTNQKGAIDGDIVKVCDYNGTNTKSKFYLDGYAGDKGKRYCGINQKVSALPLINDALVDYLNANKNQMTTGLAIAKRNAILGGVAAGVGGVVGAATAGAKGSALGVLASLGGAAAGIGKAVIEVDNITQQHNAQIADLEDQARTVDSVSGNNAEFDLADANGEIMRYIWTPSQRDRARLVEYFHKNGYAVGEWQSNISLDTMYYFDYIQAQDINFYVSGSVRDDANTQSAQPAAMPYECEVYIRNLFTRGVRIWHGRRDGDGYVAPALFKTPYLNTAKEY